MIAGVSAGLGRQLGIDPIIVRVVFVALCFAGLAGVVLYAVAWFALPSDDGRPSVMADWFRLGDNEPQVRTVALVLGAALAFASIVGDTGWFWGVTQPWFLLWLGVPALFFYWLFAVLPRQRREGRTPPAAPVYPAPPAATTPAAPAWPAYGATSAGSVATDDTAQAAAQAAADDTDADPDADVSTSPDPVTVEEPVADGGVVPPPVPPQRAAMVPPSRPFTPRTPPTLFLATMSVVLIAVGGLATVHAGAGLDIAPEVYPALALGIVGAGLLVGARWGRSIALVPIGLLMAVALLATAVFPDGPMGDIRRTPSSAAAVESSYSLGAGTLRLDLSGVSDPDELLGRTISIDGGLGQVRVILPPDLAVTVEAEINGGQIRILGEETSGQGATLDVVSDERPALTIEIDHTFGQIDVERA